MNYQAKEDGIPNSSSVPISSDVFEHTRNSNGEAQVKQQVDLVVWLNSVLPNLCLPTNATEEDLRTCLSNGTVLCRLLNRLRPGSVIECGGTQHSRSENIRRFLEAMDEMKLPRFQMSDLEKGSMKFVLECLLTLRAQYMPHSGRHNLPKPSSLNKCRSDVSATWQLLGPCFRGSDCSRGGVSPQVDSPTLSGEDSWKGASHSKFHRCMSSPVIAEASAALKHHARHEFHEVFQLKQGCYADLPDEKISEMMKSNSLDNAPTQSLLNLVNGILYESVESNNWKIPPCMAGLLRKVMQAIERRISAQAEHLRNQNNIFKSREKKYQSRIKVLEALAIGSSEEPNIFKYNPKSDCQQEFHSHCWWPAFSFKRSSDSRISLIAMGLYSCQERVGLATVLFFGEVPEKELGLLLYAH